MRRKLWCTMSSFRLKPNAEPFFCSFGSPNPNPNPNRPDRSRSFSQSPHQWRARPPDHRNWVPTRSPPPPRCERFRVVSYNILADYLAREHRSKLYFHVPWRVLDWEWRKRRILFELGLWSADILCLQEVDRFADLQEALSVPGYQGIWKMRTGAAIDGCATFWRANRFQLRHEEHIEFNKLGLRDNVAQICVLESRGQPSLESDSVLSRRLVVVCNIHVLYNPKRGDVKLGQVRVLIDKAISVSRLWNDAAVIVCGDFNSTPKSPLYNFISEKKLDLSGLPRDQISGQYSCVLTPTYHGDNFQRLNLPQENNYIKYGSIGPEKSNAGNPNEHKASGEIGVDLDAITSVKQVVDDPSHLHLNDVEIKVTDDKTINVAEEDSINYSIQDHKETFCHANTIGEVCIANEVIPGETSESSAGVQMLSETVYVNIKHELKQSIEISSTDRLLLKENELCSGFGADVLNHKVSDSIANGLNQELVAPSSKAKATLNIEKHISDLHTGVDATTKAGNNRGSTNILQDNIKNSDKNQGCLAEVFGGSEQYPKEYCWSNEGISTVCSNENTLDEENLFNSCQMEDSDPNFLAQLRGKNSIDESTGNLMASNNNSQIPQHSILSVHNHVYDPSQWTSTEIEIASGNAERSLLHHGLNLKSAYAEVKDFSGTKDADGEPHVTSYNRQFMGTVDYIWFSDGLQTVRVLDTIPKDVLRRTPGFPTPKWGSDHLAIACEFAFLDIPAQNI